MVAGEYLSISDIEAFDPNHKRRDGETRACCPFCGDAKPIDEAHRSLTYNAQTGLFRCWRCHTKGQIREHWKPLERSPFTSGGRSSVRDRAAKARAAFGLGEKSTQVDTAPARAALPKVSDQKPAKPMRETLAACIGGRKLESVATGPGAAYLLGRGLDPEFCSGAGVRFAPSFYGARAAVAFALRGDLGQLVALQGRYIDGKSEPRMRTAGDKRRGVFSTPGALDNDAVPVFVEAPIDALSLAAAGMPAIALCGSDGIPEWLIMRLAFRCVVAAFDADEAGDKAAVKLATLLLAVGGTVKRLRPVGAKDWNELLQNGGVIALQKETQALRCLALESRSPEPEAGPVREIAPAGENLTKPHLCKNVSPLVASFKDFVNDAVYYDVLAEVRAAAFGSRLPELAEPLRLHTGERITDLNGFVLAAYDRAEGLKSQLAEGVTGRGRDLCLLSLERIAQGLDFVAAWYVFERDLSEGKMPDELQDDTQNIQG